MRFMLLLFTAVAPFAAHAAEVGETRDLGLGIVLGEPTGITGKAYLSREHALDVTLGTGTYDDGRDSGLWLSLVYLWHPSVLHSDPSFDLGWHFGVGGFITDRQIQDDAAIGARVPIGLDVTLHDVPVQFFLDVSADVEVLPDPIQNLWLGLGLGPISVPLKL